MPKNNEGKTVIDYLDDFVMESEYNDEAKSILEVLKCQIPSLQSLAAMKAKAVISGREIPKKFQKFICMH